MFFPVKGFPGRSCATGTADTLPLAATWDYAENNGTVIYLGGSANVLTSSDVGANWTDRSAALTGIAALNTLDDGANGDIYVWGQGTPPPFNFVWVSTDDGVSFTRSAITGISWIPGSGVAFDGTSVFVVAANEAGGAPLTTSRFGYGTGISFTEVIVSVTGGGSDGIVHRRIGYASALTQFVATARGQGTGMAFCFRSTNGGQAWTQTSLPISRQWQDVTWNGQVWCMVGFSAAGGNNLSCLTSPDGVTWTERTMATSLQWISVTSFPDGTLMAFPRANGGATTNVMNMSIDNGVTWFACTLPSTSSWGDAVTNAATNQAVVAGRTTAESILQF